MTGVIERVDVSTPRVLSLCSGYGGLELGLGLIFGVCRIAAHCERDYTSARILAARMDDGTIPVAPIWDDVSIFPAERFTGYVDIVTAGFPCQPFSVAGKRWGTADERWIWPDIARIIRTVRPRYVFLENVPGLVRHGLSAVLGDLAEAGFDAEWDCFSASGLGATHKRERLFIVAYTHSARESQPGRHNREQRQRIGDRREEMDGVFPPGPNDEGGWRAWVEAGGGVPVERAVRGGANGHPGRVDRLFALGNGVVPVVAAYAFATLASRAGMGTP